MTSRSIILDLGKTPPNFNDVNADTFVTPIDALLIINHLKNVGTGLLPIPPSNLPPFSPPPFLDVNGDGNAAASDAQQVIAALNSASRNSIRQADGEPADPVSVHSDESATLLANLGGTVAIGQIGVTESQAADAGIVIVPSVSPNLANDSDVFFHLLDSEVDDTGLGLESAVAEVANETASSDSVWDAAIFDEDWLTDEILGEEQF